MDIFEKHPRHTHQVLVEDRLEVPSQLTDTVCHLRSSFPRDLGNRSLFSQNNMPSVVSDSSRVLLTMIEGTS